MSEDTSNGIVNIRSPYSVVDTTERLVSTFQAKGFQIFAQIDQQEAAHESGLSMSPMILLLFGNPAGGTPLMLAYPSLAIDLPLKALIWEDVQNEVWVSINSPEYLQQRHGLPITPFAGIKSLIEKAMSDQSP